jgi:hypothetical protein
MSADTTRTALLLMHGYDLELVQNEHGQWSVVLPIDRYYTRREDAEQVARECWAPDLDAIRRTHSIDRDPWPAPDRIPDDQETPTA